VGLFVDDGDFKKKKARSSFCVVRKLVRRGKPGRSKEEREEKPRASTIKEKHTTIILRKRAHSPGVGKIGGCSRRIARIGGVF